MELAKIKHIQMQEGRTQLAVANLLHSIPQWNGQIWYHIGDGGGWMSCGDSLSGTARMFSILLVIGSKAQSGMISLLRNPPFLKKTVVDTLSEWSYRHLLVYFVQMNFCCSIPISPCLVKCLAWAFLHALPCMSGISRNAFFLSKQFERGKNVCFWCELGKPREGNLTRHWNSSLPALRSEHLSLSLGRFSLRPKQIAPLPWVLTPGPKTGNRASPTATAGEVIVLANLLGAPNN